MKQVTLEMCSLNIDMSPLELDIESLIFFRLLQGGSRQYLNYTFPVLPVSLTQFIEYVAFHEDFNEITMQFV